MSFRNFSTYFSIIFFHLKLDIFFEKIFKLFLIIFLDLTKGPINKIIYYEKIFLLILILKIKPIKKNKYIKIDCIK